MQASVFSGGSVGSQTINASRGFNALWPVSAKKNDPPPQSRIPLSEMPPLWWVCTTHISYVIARKLYAAGLNYYLPLEERKVVSFEKKGSDTVKRKRTKQFPLFPGWIFLNGEASRNLAYDLYLRPQALHAKYQPIFHADLLEIEQKLLFDKYQPPSVPIRKGENVTTNGGFEGTVDTINAVRQRVEVILKNGIVCETDIMDVESRNYPA